MNIIKNRFSGKNSTKLIIPTNGKNIHIAYGMGSVNKNVI